MALIFSDGFDYYNVGDVFRKWSQVTISQSSVASGFSRNSKGMGYDLGGDGARLHKDFSGIEKDYTFTIGAALKFNSYYNGDARSLFRMYLGDLVNGTQAVLDFRPLNKTIQVFRGESASLGLIPNVYNPASFNYFEWKMYKHATSGTCEVRVNGNILLSLTGQNTQQAGTLPYDWVFLYSNDVSPHTWVDDLYICNSSGTVNNGFLGNISIVTLYPNAIGDSNDFMPSGSPTNYQNVNERVLSTVGTGGFNWSSGIGMEDLYHFDNFDIPIANVKALVLNLMLNQSGQTLITTVPELKVNGTVYSGKNLTLSQSAILNYKNIWEINPDTSGIWTQADIEALQAGLKLT